MNDRSFAKLFDLANPATVVEVEFVRSDAYSAHAIPDTSQIEELIGTADANSCLDRNHRHRGTDSSGE